MIVFDYRGICCGLYSVDGLEDSTNNMRLVAGEKMVAPEQFYRYPSTEEVQQFVPAGKGSSRPLAGD